MPEATASSCSINPAERTSVRMNARQPTLWAVTLLFVLAGIRAEAAPSTNAPPPFVGSTAGQFGAYTHDPVWSSVLCVLGGHVKHEWLKTLDLPDRWRDPIVIVVNERPAADRATPAVWMETLRTDLHLKFQVQLRVPPPLERSQVVSALVQALCAEYANRDRLFLRQPPFATTAVPPWLVEGLAQSVAGEPDKMLAVIQRSVNSGRPAAAEDLIGAAATPTEPGEQLRFQAHAWALVESLLSLPKGAEKFCQLMREPETFAEIYRWQFRDAAAREKWWSLQLAERATATVAEDWSATETSRRLAAILPSKLQMELPDAIAEAPVAFANLWRYTKSAWLTPLVRDKLAQFASVRNMAHPSYRGAVEHYIAALQYLLQGNANRFRRETKLAERQYAAADEQSHKISRYVDQIERVHTPPDRAAVWRQLKLFEAIQETNILRRDPIGDYLDKFDR